MLSLELLESFNLTVILTLAFLFLELTKLLVLFCNKKETIASNSKVNYKLNKNQ